MRWIYIEGAGEGVKDLVCADVIIEEDVLAMFDSLRGQRGGHDLLTCSV